MQRVGICAVAIMISFFLVLPSHAFFNSDVKKAKEFIKADMYPQAIELLNKRINDEPADAEAHHLLGVCYLQQGNIGMADQRFDSAVKLESKLKTQVAKVYMQSAKKMMGTGNAQSSIQCYRKAASHQPSHKPEIVELCLKKASNSSLGQDALWWLKNCEYFLGANQSHSEALFRISALKAAELWPKKSHQDLKEFAKKYDDGKRLAGIFPPSKQATIFSSGQLSVKDYASVGCLELLDWKAIHSKVRINDKVYLICRKSGKEFYHDGIMYDSGNPNIGRNGWLPIRKGFNYTITRMSGKGYVQGWIDPKIPEHNQITIEAIIKRDVPQKPNTSILMDS